MGIGELVKRGLVLLAVLALAGGGYFGWLVLKAKRMSAAAVAALSRGGTKDDCLPLFAAAAAHGSEQDQWRYRQVLAAFGVAADTGAFRVPAAGTGGATAEPVKGLRFEVTACAWGEKLEGGIQPTCGWVNFLLFNATDAPIIVQYDNFLLNDGGWTWASAAFLQNSPTPLTLAPGQGVRGCLFIPGDRAAPRYLEFNDTKLVLRAPVLWHYLMDECEHDSLGLPGARAEQEFPLRTPFKDQLLSDAEAAKLKKKKSWKFPPRPDSPALTHRN